MRVFVLLLPMLITACSISATGTEANDSALCEGLKAPVDEFVEVLIDKQKETPDEVIIKGTTVVKGYDSGCK